LGIANLGVGTPQLANGAVTSTKLGLPLSLSYTGSSIPLNVEITGPANALRGESSGGTGVGGRAGGANSAGVYGVTNQMTSYGVWGKNESTGYGVFGESVQHGVHGKTTGTGLTNYGVYGEATSAAGVGGYATTGYGVKGMATSGAGVRGQSSNGNALSGETGTGVAVYANNTSKSTWSTLASSLAGVYGHSGDVGTWGGYFYGNVNVSGALSKSSGSFKIDHPLDPANRYLYHSFVESPDMMNVYNGNLVTDAEGRAVVEMPAYFEALNRDFRYQLTVIGQFAQAIVEQKVENNRFTIRTNLANVEVSWQVTGIRKDPWAERNRIQVEVDKAPDEQGLYIHPEVYDQPAELAIDNALGMQER
jgi:hypothetical protein